MEILLVMNALVFLALFCKWSSEGMPNLTIKVFLFCLLIGNLIAALFSFGVVAVV